MPLFQNKSGKLEKIKELKFKLEKDVQKLTEDNIATIFSLKFIVSEFQLNNLRIDTLAFDEETKSFVIIEYKRDRSFSVVDQGFAYLSLMLNNKADFILEYNERMKDNLRKDDIDWSQTRVVFVAESFTTYQRNAINFKDLPIELWEAKPYSNSTVLYSHVKAKNATESIKTISKNKSVSAVEKEIKQYTIEDHFKSSWSNGKALFDSLLDRLNSIYKDLDVRPVKHYMGIRIEGNSNLFIVLQGRQNGVKIELLRVRPTDLKDPDKRTKYMKDSLKFYGKHISIFDIKNEEDVEYALFLVKQIYEKYYK